MGSIGKIFGGSKRSYTAAKTSTPATAAAKQTEEDDSTELATTSSMLGIKKKGKKALVTQPAAANVGGDGASGLNIPKG
jgi:hypothetical protein